MDRKKQEYFMIKSVKQEIENKFKKQKNLFKKIIDFIKNDSGYWINLIIETDYSDNYFNNYFNKNNDIKKDRAIFITNSYYLALEISNILSKIDLEYYEYFIMIQVLDSKKIYQVKDLDNIVFINKLNFKTDKFYLDLVVIKEFKDLSDFLKEAGYTKKLKLFIVDENLILLEDDPELDKYIKLFWNIQAS
jgi:hypothetical protein